jgi:hypothetical protein
MGMSEGVRTVADYDAVGRRDTFNDGAHGGDTVGAGTHAASSIQQGVQPGFSPGSVLQIPNMIQSVNGMSSGTYSKSLPMQSMMRNATGYGTGGNGTMNV